MPPEHSYKSAPNVQKHACNVYSTYCNGASILHATVAGWGAHCASLTVPPPALGPPPPPPGHEQVQVQAVLALPGQVGPEELQPPEPGPGHPVQGPPLVRHLREPLRADRARAGGLEHALPRARGASGLPPEREGEREREKVKLCTSTSISFTSGISIYGKVDVVYSSDRGFPFVVRY